MIKAEAWLEGSVLYIGDHMVACDYTAQEAVEEIEGLQGMPGAPTGVRIFHRPRRRRRSHTGWPMDLAVKFEYGTSTGTGWPDS